MSRETRNVVVRRLRRQQQFTGLNVAALTLLQQFLDVIRANALKKLEPFQQRTLVVQIDDMQSTGQNFPSDYYVVWSRDTTNIVYANL